MTYFLFELLRDDLCSILIIAMFIVSPEFLQTCVTASIQAFILSMLVWMAHELLVSDDRPQVEE